MSAMNADLKKRIKAGIIFAVAAFIPQFLFQAGSHALRPSKSVLSDKPG